MVVEKFTLTGPTFISVSKIILELFRKLFCFISRSFLKKLECVQNKRNSNQFVRAFWVAVGLSFLKRAVLDIFSIISFSSVFSVSFMVRKLLRA